MKRILAISGSRADYGLLEWPVKVLRENFEVEFRRLDAETPAYAFQDSSDEMESLKPDCLLILGDRWEILQAAIAAHLHRIPIAHIGGGDVSLGSYDDAMRDCITRLATYHFVTSWPSFWKVHDIRTEGHVHMVGNIAIDYIRHGDWKRDRPYAEPYVVVSYQAETIDGYIEQDWTFMDNDIKTIFLRPNPDNGSDKVNALLESMRLESDIYLDALPHAEFLNLIYHCELFIGNSSSMLYECPELGVKTQIIGKRQQGRVVPTGDGKASERIREILCRVL